MAQSMEKVKRKKGIMAIKIDFEKAYDRLRWGFINTCLSEFSLTPHIVNVIMECVSFVAYNQE